ncbi:Type II restriction/modification system, DNA methylase subunit YeeA [Fodinibius salinus]|uniref:site-specific DNA-methyltransferase (adenine-specific) n=1 Tax=Fodinibius salinus TaxID=860790 RepID=A0A5D3YPA2_9BACT|nr:Eco57I restriction-modification methylase domain-containing protein [Fodinibius salinus]TYP94859.1 Type II restriction/modification system, DNA methylase subunit YeeA [Fodinibius salinus]
MQIETITARKAVDNAFLQETITETEFESFRQRLLKLLNQADDAVEDGESEEHLKGLIKPFLNNTNFEEKYYINTKKDQDLAIYNGESKKSDVGVIIEAKRPSNRSQMITKEDVNKKGFQQSIFYYLRERIDNGNEDIKYVIVTDVYNWFIFDAQDYERYFYNSKKLRDWYQEWKKGQKVSSGTQFVYDHLSEFIEDLDVSIKAAQVDIQNYRKLLDKKELSRDEQKKLVPLFKLFTPTHLLKEPFASDSNELNKGFYRELLYIMGLKEYKEKGTHYITRLDEENRQHASLIENTITQLKSMSVLSRMSNKSEFGDSEEEQVFNVAIQLLITWINRILFLKLLEAQLYKYHKEEDRFRFLSHEDIEEYDELNKLFFQVLARKYDERSDRINRHFGHIPYLNSSLFDVSDIEGDALAISALEDSLQMPVHNRSKITDKDGQQLKGKSLSTLEYLLRFLDAYNFNTEGTAEVQKEAKTLINASVLGRIFEKINGYKDGSFFTPGYITEYMCSETIRRAVVQKFNEAYEDWDCKSVEEVADKIARYEVPYPEANEIVNSITICDPAVGSGHFLVSALNELIAIKNDLRIFVDEDNHRFRDVDISVDNDELSIAWGSDPFFEYRVTSEFKENGRVERSVGSDTQRLQKALFREKNILIENCLFGVDINPNSVNICRLRLWIELLKHAYYRKDTDFQALEVLPNIDINIKQGNSLVSRFDLDADLSQILANNDDLTIEEYKQAVRSYKETGDGEDKRALKEQISSIKESFSVGLKELHPVRQKLKKQREILIKKEAKLDLFEGEKKSKKEQKKIKKTKKKIGKLEEELDELESATFYDQAFEWRFEFPEVLDEDGNFTGFDAVIGNPPYIRQELLKEIKPYLKENYQVYSGYADLYQYFVQRGLTILKNGGYFHYIVSNKWMRASYGQPLRTWIQQYQIKSIIDFGDLPVFQEATAYPCLLQITKSKVNQDFIATEVENLKFDDLEKLITNERFVVDQNKLKKETWSLIGKSKQEFLSKIENKAQKLEEIVDGNIFRGVISGLDDAFVINEEKRNEILNEDRKSEEVIFPYLRGKDVGKYSHLNSSQYIIFMPSGWTDEKTTENVEDKWVWLKESYPGVANHLKPYADDAKKRYDQGKYWWELRPCDYFEEFKSPKLLYLKFQVNPAFTLDLDGHICNSAVWFVSETDKQLLAILNSKLGWFLISNYCTQIRNGYQLIYKYLKNIPIILNDTLQSKFESLVDQILTAKKEDSDADTSKLEEEIDQLVYELYGLSEEEIAIIEESIG